MKVSIAVIISAANQRSPVPEYDQSRMYTAARYGRRVSLPKVPVSEPVPRRNQPVCARRLPPLRAMPARVGDAERAVRADTGGQCAGDGQGGVNCKLQIFNFEFIENLELLDLKLEINLQFTIENSQCHHLDGQTPGVPEQHGLIAPELPRPNPPQQTRHRLRRVGRIDQNALAARQELGRFA